MAPPAINAFPIATVINIVITQVLGGHEGPVSCLCFSPVQSVLASASWDRTIRLWDMMDSWQVKETFYLTSDGKTHPLLADHSATC